MVSVCSMMSYQHSFPERPIGKARDKWIVLDDFLKCSPSKALFATDFQWI